MAFVVAVALTSISGREAYAAQVLYGFDTDETYRVADWLTSDGSQDAVGLGAFSVNKSAQAAFGVGAVEFPTGGVSFGALEIPETSQLGSSFTLSVMANELGNNFSRLFSSYNGGPVGADELVFDIDPSGSIGFGVRAIVNGVQVRRDLSFIDASYHHLAMTYEDGSVQLYFDGAPLGAAATTPPGQVQLAQNLRFGEDYPPTSLTNEAFEGFADDILVYDRALTPGEIASLHSAGAASLFGVFPPPPPEPLPPLSIGSRIEMFVDRQLIESSNEVDLKLHPPAPQEIVLQLNAPFESSTSTYFTALRDEENKVRLYYRGYVDSQEVTLMAVSDDGVNFIRPSLGIFEHNDSGGNHIVWEGPQSHNMAPFRDPNPDAAPDAKWKALGGTGAMYAMKSADGIHWELMQDDPLAITGQFDSQNTAMWDEAAGVYRSFSRVWVGGKRSIQMSTSEDFLEWTPPQPFIYDEALEHFYTNAIVQLPGAEGLLVGFPMRLDTTRTNQPSPGQTGVSDAVLITSRDGVHWDRELSQPWIPEGFDTTRSNMPAWGIIETDPQQWSTYVTEQYRLSDNRLRRLTFRSYGMASVSADEDLGWFETPTFSFEGEELLLNFRTQIGGNITVEIRDQNGVPIPGFGLAEGTALSGDELWAAVRWASGRSVRELRGTPIRLYFELQGADLFALQFAAAADTGIVGDYNNDGTVDASDYTVWRDALGGDGRLSNDPIGGRVGADHYAQWRANYGNSVIVPPPGGRVSVPAPGGRQLITFTAAAMCVGLGRRVPCNTRPTRSRRRASAMPSHTRN